MRHANTLHPFSVTLSEVKKNPQNYTFLPGAGHLLVGPITTFGGHPRNLADAPLGAADESYHLLLPPNGAAPMAFQWLAAPRQWFRLDSAGRALRTGWTPVYLSSWGWRYAGQARG
jgi:hypothetical protein